MAGARSPESCLLCAAWGTVTGSGLCAMCRNGRYRVQQGKLREAVCRRCAWPGIVGVDGTCRGCRIAVRLGEDEAWVRAELERRTLPPGRPLQLAVHIGGLRLSSFPLRHNDRPLSVVKLPAWARDGVPPLPNDPAVCVEEIPGQLGLFAPWPRSFTRSHGQQIRGRGGIPDLPAVLAVLQQMALERGVEQTWMFHTGDCARLALAARPPDERLVRPEALDDLPQMRPTLLEALDRAGLLASPRPRLLPSWMAQGHGSCRECLAWTNEKDQRCAHCLDWGIGRGIGPCHRCLRVLPLRDDHCRRCVLFVAETEYDVDAIALSGGDQLWFGGPFAPRLRTSHNPAGEQAGLYGRRRFQARRHTAVSTSRAARPVSAHLAAPGQLELFHMARDWSRLDDRQLPALTAPAQQLLDAFDAHIRSRGWTKQALGPSMRTLRILVAHLGAEAPLLEEDVRLLARRDNLSGARLINYLRLVGQLIPDQRADSAMARARRLADAAPAPFRDPVHRWIDVLSGRASRPSWPLAPATVYAYVRITSPCLRAWHDAGVDTLRAVTRAHIEQTLDPGQGEAAKTLATALRSLFRALKREKLIFRDPARRVSLTTARPLPAALPKDRLHGVLETITGTRNQLSFVLAAVHALSVEDQRRLLMKDLDRSSGRLLVRRRGKMNHTIYLDELTSRLAGEWLTERYRRWPTSTNPYLLVTARTAVDDAHPRVCQNAITKSLRRQKLQVTSLRVDRMLDEAKHNADPLHLVRLFGISPITAMRYLRAAHPAGTRPDPTQP